MYKNSAASVADSRRVAPTYAPGDIFELYTPPFRLLSQMALGLLLAPTAPLRRIFPQVPFLSLAGKTPLLVWFATVQQIVYQRDGGKAAIGAPDAPLYQEVTVIALLRKRGFFVPGIYANDTLTLQVGWRYGMPKVEVEIYGSQQERAVAATMKYGAQESDFQLRPRLGLQPLARLLERFLPLPTWQVAFPSGAALSVLLTEAPLLRAGRVRGQLNLAVDWLPEPTTFFPWGLYLPRQVMIMPAVP